MEAIDEGEKRVGNNHAEYDAQRQVVRELQEVYALGGQDGRTGASEHCEGHTARY